jgi:twinkle protein
VRREHTPGTVTHKGPCDACGSSDARAFYDNGTSWCFSGNCQPKDRWACDEAYEGSSEPKRKSVETEEGVRWREGTIAAIEKRKLTIETCKKWGYKVGDGCQIANYRDETGELVAQKLRLPGKDFKSIGRKNKPLYGMWLWPTKGRSITITEGEIDALSVSQAFENNWPVVSLPDGSSSAEKAIKQHFEYLCAFEKIVLMFDADKPGREAVDVAASILPVGKVYVAKYPDDCKDANDVLVKHGKAKLSKCFWDASPWRPDGIVAGEDISLEDMMADEDKGYEIRLPELQRKMLGLREAEITLLTAGSGIGKSTAARQLVYELRKDHKLKFGNIFLEERNRTTAQAFVALDNRVPLAKLRFNKSIITPDQWRKSKEEVIHNGMYFYNHFGSLESDNLITKMRYMRNVLGVNFAVLDHISIVTSGMESSSEGERKDIDILMTRLASLTQETGLGIIAIAHLKRAQGKVFNEGDQVSLTDLRGSAALEQLSHNVIALERNQQDEEGNQDTMRYRILKCREVGDLGLADTVVYNRDTGWLDLPQAIGL